MTNLSTAIATLITALAEAKTTIYTEANANKANLIAAIEAMKTSQLKMNEFVDLTSLLANAAEEYAEDMNVSAEHVGEMLCDMNTFAMPIEQFDGYCEICGKELSVDDEQFMDEDGDGWVCTECEKQLHPEPEIEIAESVEG